MQKRRFWQYFIYPVTAVAVTVLGVAAIASADASSSTHYQVNETQFGGSGADLKDCSTSYCAKISVGDTTVGAASSADYSAQFGSNTSDEPLLQVITTAGVQDLGILDTSHTATATRIIKVRTYLSSGYVVELTGTPPSQGSHALSAISTPSTSQPGAEQFGVNLVANTSPSVGADPLQVPSSLTSFGVAATDYATPNLFKYVSGDIIASSPTSSGETDYTLSAIFNVSNTTPGGHYDGSFSAVVVPIY